MNNTHPRDVQYVPIATDTLVLRARSWTRLRFEIEFARAKGTTVNSYMIQGNRTALIDPTPETFAEIYLEALRQCTDWRKIDYIILGHFNPNRLATLKMILERAPQITFVTSVLGASHLKEAFPDQELKVLTMRGKASLDLGKGHVLRFIPTPSPRWPEGLCTYDSQTQILYTGKLFASHVCGDEVFDEQWETLKEDQRYYFDCLMASNAPHVLSALEKMSDLPVRMYGVGHGPLLRYGLIELTKYYQQWSRAQSEREISVALLYASAYGNTATLARAIAFGLNKGGAAVQSINCEFVEPEQIRAVVEKADGFIIGSPTIGGHAPTPIHTALGTVLTIAEHTKIAGVFGSYGWSGEAFDLIEGKLKEAGYKLGFETLKVKFKPSDAILKQCEEIGTDFVQVLKKTNKIRTPQTAATPTEQAVGRIIGSVYVLTAKQGDVSTGMLGTWVSQATFSPPGITIAIAKERAAESLLYSESKFVLNLIPEGKHQKYMKHFRQSFAPGEERFARFSTAVADNGCTIFCDASAYLECTVHQRMECGDHWVLYATVDNGKLVQSEAVTAIHHRKTGTQY
ncbi:NAD(P)H-quinone oxidoreductase chain 5 [Richelia intracellularis]|nr:NAD(P)H-quinone oxidoreductase chain 5 [Richelia intracellularis]